MEKDKENCNGSVINTPTQLLHQTLDTSVSSRTGTPIRPLTAAYKAASNDHEVVQSTHTPQKSSGLLSKAVEYIFGW